MCNAKYNSHTDPLFKECNILKFEDLNKLNGVKLMYKKTQGKIHNYHASKLKTNSQIYDRDTRQKYDVKIIGEKHNNLTKINSLNYKIGTSWNELPLNLKRHPL